MANISAYLAAIQAAVFGEEVRGSIHDAIEIINLAGEKVLTAGTAVDSPSSSVVGYFSGSLYINTDTSDLWECNGTSWVKKSSIKGEAGKDGNKMLRGSAVTGKSKAQTIFTVPNANVDDFYMNTSNDETNTGNIYSCTQVFSDGTSAWVYEFTMVGGGSGGASDWSDLENKPFESLGSDFEVPTTGTDTGVLKLAEAVTEKLDILDGTGLDADLFLSTDGEGGLTWVEAPNGTKRYLIGTIPAEQNMLGVWQQGDEEDWVMVDEHGNPTFVFDEAFYEDADNNEVISLDFYFDSKTNQPIYLAGYQWWNVDSIKKGGINVVLGNIPDSPVDIWIEVMRTIENP